MYGLGSRVHSGLDSGHRLVARSFGILGFRESSPSQVDAIEMGVHVVWA